jgi:aldehyde:ferredoxin oxidoreductase
MKWEAFHMGFIGRLLEIDLTDERTAISTLSDEVIWGFLGGRGLNAWLLHQNAVWYADPLGPENTLLLSCGLLTGTEAPASSRLHVSARSPLTGAVGNSNAGGGFGSALRSNGFQSILIRGRAKRPVFLWICNGSAEIRDADSLWGCDTFEAEDRLKKKLGRNRLRVMAIGPGGENLVPFASIMVDHDHTAGRTGMGAVMGSKNVKAIAVRGKDSKEPMDPLARATVRDYIRRIKSSPAFHRIATYGSPVDVRWAHDMGMLATRNYTAAQFEGVDEIDGKKMLDFVTRAKSCYRCPVHCKADVALTRGRFKGMTGARPEFESIIALGSKCGLDEAEAVIYLNDLCSRVGIDTISTGSAIAFAMDLYDRGILTREDSGGMDLGWGNHRSMEVLIHQIVHRQGLGAILSRGVREAARIIGRGSERFAYHTKGLELTGFDPRGLMGTALGYAVSERGGDFNSFYATMEYRWSEKRAEEELGSRSAVRRFATEGKGALIKRALVVSAVLDSLGICKVPALTLIGDFDLKNEAALTASLTGWSLGAEELQRVGERIVNLDRLFNLRSGVRAEDDRIPDRFLDEPISEGPAEGQTVKLASMVEDFYDVMGWNDAGEPSKKTLKALDLTVGWDGAAPATVGAGETGQGVYQPSIPVRKGPVKAHGAKEPRRARGLQ